MQVYIFTDMEGISGVSGSDFVTADGAFYQAGRRYYTDDMNVCARACFEAGADRVIIRDGHGGGNHALWEELDERVEVVRGHGGNRRMPGVEGSHAVILLGYHAMAGTPDALLEHTYSSRTIQNMWLNDRRVGEIGIDAAVVGRMGIPTIMVSGDDKACAEAEDWIPGVVSCRVKVGLACQGARLLSRRKAHERIARRTAEAIEKRDVIEPLRVETPVRLRVEKVERQPIPNTWAREEIRRIDARTYEVTAETVEQALNRT